MLHECTTAICNLLLKQLTAKTDEQSTALHSSGIFGSIHVDGIEAELTSLIRALWAQNQEIGGILAELPGYSVPI